MNTYNFFHDVNITIKISVAGHLFVVFIVPALTGRQAHNSFSFPLFFYFVFRSGIVQPNGGRSDAAVFFFFFSLLRASQCQLGDRSRTLNVDGGEKKTKGKSGKLLQ